MLEIHSGTGRITRTLEVGSDVTDLAIHHKEGKLYLPNWKVGELLAVDMETFGIVGSHRFSPFKGVGYSRSDVYKVSAGRKGRLILEAADQWIDMSIFDTEAGKVVDKTNVRQGGGAFPAPGRYYFHGDSNISNAALHKYDTVGDVFKEVATARSKARGHHGSRTVLASGDGTKVFWNGSMFDANLEDSWPIGEEIVAVSPDGKLAFGVKNIYDVEGRREIFSMPTNPKPCAYNPVTKTLVAQDGEKIGFYPIPDPADVKAPTLELLAIETLPIQPPAPPAPDFIISNGNTKGFIAVYWAHSKGAERYILERKVQEQGSWRRIVAIPALLNHHQDRQAKAGKAYACRVKAVNEGGESAYSEPTVSERKE